MPCFAKTFLVNREINYYLFHNAFTGFQSDLKLKLHVFILILLQLIFSGCSSVNNIIKAESAPNAGFLPAPELLSEMRQRYPFHGAWMNMNVEDFHAYNSIYIAPMDTSHLSENDWWDEANLTFSSLDEDAAIFAQESEATFRESFVEGMKLSVANTPGSGTVVLELSIVELKPAKVWLSTVGLVAVAVPLSVGIPVGAAAALGQNGTVAIEGILRDGETGEIILMFADREASKIRILDFKTLTWYGHAHEIMEDWAHQLMELLTTPHDHVVPDSDDFAWSPF